MVEIGCEVTRGVIRFGVTSLNLNVRLFSPSDANLGTYLNQDT